MTVTARHTIQMPVTPLRLTSADVHAWHANIAILQDPALTDEALRWLDRDERERFDRFTRDEDRSMFLLGRVMARSLVGRALEISPTDWPWRNGPHGRPEVGLANVRVRFNLAHSAGIVVCALGWDRDIGVDVEHLARRPVEFAVVKRYCSPDEIADITAAGAEWHDRFLVYWTLKEAYLKARGLGIALPLANISFSLRAPAPAVAFTGALVGTDTRWRFHLVRPTGGHLVALAAAAADGARPRFALRPLEPDFLRS
jgi:4'-phosphopantetheinyl transferase